MLALDLADHTEVFQLGLSPAAAAHLERDRRTAGFEHGMGHR